MSLSIGGSNVNVQQTNQSNDWQKRQQSFKDLNAALQSGDLDAAKKAYQDLTNGKTVDPSSPLGQLGDALEKGDLDAAQKVAASLKNHRGGHHHHAAPPAPPPTDTSATSTASSDSNSGNTINTTA